MTGARPDQFAPVAIVQRSGVDESIHHGAVVCLNADGSIAHSIGDPNVLVYPRSSTKPLQGLAMVRNGLSLPPDQLALVCASHNGEAIHLDTARKILASVGLTEVALLNTPDHPLHAHSARDAVRNDIPKSSLQMNCSGKHSGMLATCVINGWSTENYLDQDHPLQKAITDTIPTVAGEAAAAIGTDGCGAPAHVVTLAGLARAARAIANGDAGDSGLQIYNAMSTHPYMVGGEGRDVTAIVGAIPGLFAKDGAEGVYVAAMADGRAVALKMADGFGRGRPTVLLAALRTLGVDTSAVPEKDVAEIAYGHGKPVGGVRAIGF